MQRRGALGKRRVGGIFGGLFLDLNLEDGLEKKWQDAGCPQIITPQNYLRPKIISRYGKKGLSVCFHPFFTMGRARWALKCEMWGIRTRSGDWIKFNLRVYSLPIIRFKGKWANEFCQFYWHHFHQRPCQVIIAYLHTENGPKKHYLPDHVLGDIGIRMILISGKCILMTTCNFNN